MPSILRVLRKELAGRRESEDYGPRHSTPTLILRRHDSPGAQIDAIKFAADRASNGLRELAMAVSAWNSDPTAGSVEAVEVRASAVRQDIIKIRHLRDSAPAANSTARRIAQSQLDRVSREYFDLLASLAADSERATEAMERRDVIQLPVQGLFQQQEWADYTDEQRRHVSDARARNREIRQIEKSVGSINAMMQELQGLVLQQGEGLDAVDANVEDARGETAKAYKQLGRAERLRAAVQRRKIAFGGVVGAILLIGLILLLVVIV